jgi:hypothetical protein
MRTRVAGLLQRAWRQVEFDLLGGDVLFGFGIGDLGGFRGSTGMLGDGDIFIQVDAVALEGGEQVVELLRRVHLRREEIVHLVVEQVAALLARVDELAYLVILFFNDQCQRFLRLSGYCQSWPGPPQRDTAAERKTPRRLCWHENKEMAKFGP